MAGLQGLLWLAGPWTVKGKRIQTNAKEEGSASVVPADSDSVVPADSVSVVPAAV